MKKIGNLLIYIGVFLIVLSSILIIKNKIIDNIINNKNKNIMEIIEKSIEDKNINSIENNKKYITIDHNEYIGYIHLEDSNAYLPINKEYNKTNLKYSPTVYYGTIEENNLVICAHNRKHQFGFLLNIKVGSKFIITDINNNKYEYEVCEIEELNSNQVDEMINSNYDLTLFTCTLGGKTRFTVRLNKI